jgi:four helix bundle protein
MQDFRKLKAWQEARTLTTNIYAVTASFPAEERYGLTAQMRSAAVSIGANIAEGCGKATRADTLRFFQISFGSATELLHHIITASDLGFMSKEQLESLDQRLELARRLLAGLMRRLRG